MTAQNKTIYAADLFAGAGGTSTGLIEAVLQLGCKLELVAVNHWEKAIRTHEANYPWARHFQASVEALDPREAIPGGHLDILVASPECTHFSRAAGGRPRNEQKRAPAFAIFRWIEMLDVERVLVENVPEFQTWGPLDSEGKPVKAQKGEIFRAWLRTFRAHGYSVRFDVFNAADYGAATSRNRLFVLACKGKQRPQIPKPTHTKEPTGALSGKPLKKWRPAREIIDWSTKGESIFTRKKPLSPRTVQRIIEGLKRFGGPELKPFIILMEHQGGVRSVDEPLPTITTAKGGSFGLACPEDPEPFLVAMEQVNRLGPKAKSVDEPLWTISTQGRIGIAEPFIVPNFGEDKGQAPRTHSIVDPLPSVTSHGAGNLVEPFLVEYYGTGGAESVEDPLNTVTTKDRFALAEPYLCSFYGTKDSQLKRSAHSIEEPVPAIATQNHYGLVQPQVNGKILDIKFRMLKPEELAAATGFPSDYRFLGTKTDAVKQIGNAVVVPMAKALCLSLLKKDFGGSA